jgi:hypothetical protein
LTPKSDPISVLLLTPKSDPNSERPKRYRSCRSRHCCFLTKIFFHTLLIPVSNYFLFCTFRRVFELFNNACSHALQCGAEICIDETLYANRGLGFSFKQYLPLKPSKYEFLFKSLGDSKHAYIYRSLIYAGRPAEEATEHYVKGNKKTNVHSPCLT